MLEEELEVLELLKELEDEDKTVDLDSTLAPLSQSNANPLDVIKNMSQPKKADEEDDSFEDELDFTMIVDNLDFNATAIK